MPIGLPMSARHPVRLLASLHAGVLLVALGVLATASAPAPLAHQVSVAPEVADPRRLLARTAAAPAPAPAAAAPARAGRDRLPGAVSALPLTDAARRGADRTPERRGRAALEALGYDWRRLGYRVRFLPYAGGRLGTANSKRREITIYVSASQSELSLRATLAHELGHALDFGHGTTQRRDAYRAIRRLPRGASWFPCSRCSDLSSPAGDFAESFAVWLVGPGDFRGRLRPPPDADQLRALRELFTVPEKPAARPQPRPEPAASPTRRPRPTGPGAIPLVLADPSPAPA